MSTIHAQKVYPTLGKITQFDSALESLVSVDAKVEILASGFVWSEGPVWHKKGNT